MRTGALVGGITRGAGAGTGSRNHARGRSEALFWLASGFDLSYEECPWPENLGQVSAEEVY